jgi:hypothetical protein
VEFAARWMPLVVAVLVPALAALQARREERFLLSRHPDA